MKNAARPILFNISLLIVAQYFVIIVNYQL